jgi:hypothetical protein
MASVHDQRVIEAFRPDRPHEPLGVGVGLRCPPRSAQDLDPFGAEYLVEDWAESLIPVMD